MIPTREEAMEFIRDGLACNPGPWGRHCLTAAHCAEKIAHACGDMDSEKAYILGLLHDIGRKFGVRHLGHVSDGYTYMKQSGYDEELARVTLSNRPDLCEYQCNGAMAGAKKYKKGSNHDCKCSCGRTCR